MVIALSGAMPAARAEAGASERGAAQRRAGARGPAPPRSARRVEQAVGGRLCSPRPRQPEGAFVEGFSVSMAACSSGNGENPQITLQS